MFGEFLNIIVRSLKLDKSLYKDNKYFGEAGLYFAGLIMILDGVAGAVAANTIIKTAIGISGLTAILTWFVWTALCDSQSLNSKSFLHESLLYETEGSSEFVKKTRS